jgi:phage terminase small subunit
MNPLSPKQRRFVGEYLKDQNGTQAAIRAGYARKSAKEQACDLLTKPNIREAVNVKLAKVVEKCELDAADVLKILAQLATADIRKAYNPDGTIKPIHEIPDDIAAAISSVESDDNSGEIKKFKLLDKSKALEMIGKYLKMFVERTELTDGAGSPVIIQMISAEYDAAKNNQGPDHKSL